MFPGWIESIVGPVRGPVETTTEVRVDGDDPRITGESAGFRRREGAGESDDRMAVTMRESTCRNFGGGEDRIDRSVDGRRCDPLPRGSLIEHHDPGRLAGRLVDHLAGSHRERIDGCGRVRRRGDRSNVLLHGPRGARGPGMGVKAQNGETEREALESSARGREIHRSLHPRTCWLVSLSSAFMVQRPDDRMNTPRRAVGPLKP